MKFFIRNFLLFAAMLLLLMHHMLPHQHHGQLCNAIHAQEHTSNNFTDILRTVFHNVAPNIEAGQFQSNTEHSIVIKGIHSSKFDIDYTFQLYTLRAYYFFQAQYYQTLLAHFSNKNQVNYNYCIAFWQRLKSILPLYIQTSVGFRAPPALA